MVLNAALVPTEGGCGIDCMKERHREGLLLARAAAERDGTSITLPGPPEDPQSFRYAYGGDPLDDETLAYMVDPVRCVPDTVHHYFQPVHWSAVAGIPIVYVLNEHDRPVPTGNTGGDGGPPSGSGLDHPGRLGSSPPGDSAGHLRGILAGLPI